MTRRADTYLLFYEERHLREEAPLSLLMLKVSRRVGRWDRPQGHNKYWVSTQRYRHDERSGTWVVLLIERSTLLGFFSLHRTPRLL